VLVVEVDRLDSKAAQAGLARLRDVLGLPLIPSQRPSGSRTLPNLVASMTSPRRPRIPAHEFLVPPDPVHVCGVEKGHAQVQGSVDRGDGFLIVPTRVEVGHAHAAESEADTRSPVRPRILEGIGMFVFSICRRCYYSVSELSCPVRSIPLRCDLDRLRWHVDVVVIFAARLSIPATEQYLSRDRSTAFVPTRC